MKVAFIMRYMGFRGGSELQMAKISEQLSNDFLVSWWTTNINFTYFPNLKKLNLHLARNDLKWFKFFWIIDLFLFLHNKRPDIVYSRDSRRIWLYSIICKILSIKLVWSVNFSLKDSDFSLVSLFSNIFSIKFKKGFIPFWRIYFYLNSKCFPIINLVCQSEDNRKILSKLGVTSQLIPNSVNASLLSKKYNNEKIVVYIGNLGARRRPEIFLNLCLSLSKSNIKFLMCGRKSLDRNYQKQLDSKIARLSNLNYLGEVSQDDVNEILSRASLLIYTPKVSGLSNVLLESWINETPVISYGVDLFQLTNNADISISCDHFDDLCSQVKFLMNDNEALSSLGIKCKAFAESTYSSKVINRKHINFFNSIIKI